MKKVLSLLLALLLTYGCAAAETLSLSLIGDCTIGDQYKYRGYKSGFTYKISQAGLDYPFSLAADLFAQDDLTIANCEGCFTNRASTGKFMSLGAAPEFAEVFKLGFVDVVNTANNHMRDFGSAGREDTLEALAAQGIGYFGDDDTYITEIKGVTIGIVGYTYPINEGKLKKYQKKIEELKEAGCTFIIASAHLVYGHGSHTVQPLQIYNGKLICYSLSNFTFGANAAPEDDDTVVLQVSYDIAADGSCTLGSITALPYKMHKDKDFRPYPIEDAAGKEQVWRKLVFQGEKNPDSGLPESFLTTGYADFRGMMVVDEE